MYIFGPDVSKDVAKLQRKEILQYCNIDLLLQPRISPRQLANGENHRWPVGLSVCH